MQQALQIVGPALQQDESTGDRKLNPTECALLQSAIETVKLAKSRKGKKSVPRSPKNAAQLPKQRPSKPRRETSKSIKDLLEPSENSDATMSSLEIAAIQESVENIAPLLQSAEGIEKLGLGAVEAVQLKQALKCLEEVSETGDKVAEINTGTDGGFAKEQRFVGVRRRGTSGTFARGYGS